LPTKGEIDLKRSITSCIARTVVLTCILSSAPSASGAGRAEKLRVLVDKVLMAFNKWVMTEDHVREIAEAGFNVVSPRLGNDDMNEVRKIAGLAQKYGIYHMPWMRGTLVAKGDVKLVWRDGSEQELASPNSDELWDWMTGLIVSYAKISTEYPNLSGVFLDYENYSPGNQGNCYDLSYDTKILTEFAEARGIELPGLPADERYSWLKEKGLHDKFTDFQINHWRERCRALREAVHAINPKFQFCVYPALGTLFMKEAIYPEWTTEAAPLILADPYIYGRPGGLLPHKEALKANQTILKKNLAYARSRKIPFIYMGGLDPAVRGADPEFCGRNAAMSAFATDGYWVFYEGHTYDKDHPDYFHWFTAANQAIVAGNRKFAWEKRETPDPGNSADFQRKTDKPQVGVFDNRKIMSGMIAAEGKFEVHELLGLNPNYLRNFDVVILQNYNVALKHDDPFVRTLRAYVSEGGGLMLAHDTAWFMNSPFPKIAVRGYPKYSVEAERHVVDTPLRVAKAHPALRGLQPGMEFSTEFRDHMIFEVGPKGETVIENTFGDPVYVLGEVAKGRVAYVGQYHGYAKPLSGAEREAFLGVLDWLAGTQE